MNVRRYTVRVVGLDGKVVHEGNHALITPIREIKRQVRKKAGIRKYDQLLIHDRIGFPEDGMRTGSVRDLSEVGDDGALELTMVADPYRGQYQLIVTLISVDNSGDIMEGELINQTVNGTMTIRQIKTLVSQIMNERQLADGVLPASRLSVFDSENPNLSDNTSLDEIEPEDGARIMPLLQLYVQVKPETFSIGGKRSRKRKKRFRKKRNKRSTKKHI